MSRSGVWPSPEQQLLLQAAWLKDEGAVEAWERWSAHLEARELDPACYPLLPFVYQNLRNRGQHGPAMDRLKGTVRRTWYQNQLALRKLERVLAALEEAGVRTLLVGPAALSCLQPAQRSLHTIPDLTILVERGDVERAALTIDQLGWSARYGWSDANEEDVDEASFVADDGGDILHLRWQVLSGGCQSAAELSIWKDAAEVQLGAGSALTSSPTDLLFCACAEGAQRGEGASLSWIADAMLLLQTDASRPDWDRLLSMAREQHLVAPVTRTLDYLREVLQAPVPREVLDELRRRPLSPRSWTLDGTPRTVSPRPVRWADGLRDLLATCLLKMGHGPLRSLAEWPYRYAISSMRRRYLHAAPEAIRAMYVRRSIARGDLLPGLSDLDLVVYLHDDHDTTDVRSALRRAHSAALRRLPHLDSNLEVYTEASQLEWFENDFFKYRFTEGRATWLQIYGDGESDVLSRIPDLEDAELRFAGLFEFRIYWTLFNRCILAGQLPGRLWPEYLLFKVAVDIDRLVGFILLGETHFARFPVRHASLRIPELKESWLALRSFVDFHEDARFSRLYPAEAGEIGARVFAYLLDATEAVTSFCVEHDAAIFRRGLFARPPGRVEHLLGRATHLLDYADRPDPEAMFDPICSACRSDDRILIRFEGGLLDLSNTENDRSDWSIEVLWREGAD